MLAAVMQGYLARNDCTANHPPLYPSFVAWGETVRALREHLAPTGWERNDAKNYSRTVHPNGRIAIAVATGDEATGAANTQHEIGKGPQHRRSLGGQSDPGLVARNGAAPSR